MRLCFFLLALFLGAYSYAAPSEQKFQEVADSQMWKLLLHYQDGWFKTESRADSPRFFFAPNGKKDQLAELKASYHAFKKPPADKKNLEDPRCRFPARFDFIKKELDPAMKRPRCKDFDEWLGSLDPESLVLVFTNNFPSNPASTFGHTFIRIVSKKSARVQKSHAGSKKIDLLDYYVGFSAHVDDPGIFAYIINGLSGGYPGRFDMGPYYMKVNEYNNMENRDIWEFQLNFTQEETRRVVGHIWELAMNTHFDYYFFDENCSSILLHLFQVGRPDWRLIGDSAVYVSPPETVKPLAGIPGAISKINYRPSQYKKYSHKVGLLNSTQEAQFKKVLEGSIAIESIDDPYVLETSINFFLFLKKSNVHLFNEKYKSQYMQLLVKRSQIKGETDARFNRIISASRPDLSHGDNLASFSVGARAQRTFEEFGLRVALHDMLASDIGQPKYSNVEVMNARFRLYNQEVAGIGKFQLDEFTFLRLGSFFPSSSFETKWSYQVDFKNYIPKDIHCLRCNVWHFSASGGQAAELITDRLLLFALLGGRLEYQKYFEGNLRYGPELNAGAHFRSEKYRNQIGLKSFWDVDQNQRQNLSHQIYLHNSLSLHQNGELRLNFNFMPDKLKRSSSTWEHTLGYIQYF